MAAWTGGASQSENAVGPERGTGGTPVAELGLATLKKESSRTETVVARERGVGRMLIPELGLRARIKVETIVA